MSKTQPRKLSIAGLSPTQQSLIERKEPARTEREVVPAEELPSEKPEVAKPAAEVAPVPSAPKPEKASVAKSTASPSPAKPTPRAPKPKAKPALLEEEEVAYINQTYQIPVPIVEALQRISMERKIRKVRPSTIKAIVNQALEEWLEREQS